MNIKERNALKFALFVAFGGFVFGLDAAVVSGTIRYISSQLSLSPLEIGTVVSAPSLGAVIALLIAGKCVDSLGRKKTLLGIAGLYLVSAIWSALATSYISLTIARGLGGLAFCSLGIASMYIGEISPAKFRGKLVSCNQLSIVLGLSAAYFVNYYLVMGLDESSFWFSSENIWRVMFASEIIPAIIWLLLLTRIPESPRWLALKGQKEKSIEVISQISSENSEGFYHDIRGATESKSDSTNLLKQFKFLFSGPMKLVLIVGVSMAAIQGLIGMNAVLFYAPTVFEQIGLGVNASFQQATYIGLTSIVFTVLAIIYIDKFGRRGLLLFGLAAAALSHMTIWYGFDNATYTISDTNIQKIESVIDVEPLKPHLGEIYTSDVEFKNFLIDLYGENEIRNVSSEIIQASIDINPTLIILGILGFIAAFHISIGPIMWVIFSEICPTVVRSVAIPFFSLVASFLSYVIQKFFPWQLATYGAGDTFLMYGFVAILGLIFTYFVMPETKNKTIEEIETELVTKSA